MHACRNWRRFRTQTWRRPHSHVDRASGHQGRQLLLAKALRAALPMRGNPTQTKLCKGALVNGHSRMVSITSPPPLCRASAGPDEGPSQLTIATCHNP